MNLFDRLQQKINSYVFWRHIIITLKRLKVPYETWTNEYFVLPHRDEICGIRGKLSNGIKYSIVSHRFSYGGPDELFEMRYTYEPRSIDEIVGNLKNEHIANTMSLLVQPNNEEEVCRLMAYLNGITYS